MPTKENKSKNSDYSDPKAKSEDVSSETKENDTLEIASEKTGVRINP